MKTKRSTRGMVGVQLLVACLALGGLANLQFEAIRSINSRAAQAQAASRANPQLALPGGLAETVAYLR